MGGWGGRPVTQGGGWVVGRGGRPVTQGGVGRRVEGEEDRCHRVVGVGRWVEREEEERMG